MILVLIYLPQILLFWYKIVSWVLFSIISEVPCIFSSDQPFQVSGWTWLMTVTLVSVSPSHQPAPSQSLPAHLFWDEAGVEHRGGGGTVLNKPPTTELIPCSPGCPGTSGLPFSVLSTEIAADTFMPCPWSLVCPLLIMTAFLFSCCFSLSPSPKARLH